MFLRWFNEKRRILCQDGEGKDFAAVPFDFDLFDHVAAIEKHGAPIDLVIKHSEVIPFYIKSRYLKQNSIEVMDKGDLKQPVIECELLTFKDNLVRHDPQKIKKVVEDILKELD